MSKTKDFRTEYKLNHDHVLFFITEHDKTVCVCDTLEYEKLVAHHSGSKDLKKTHESVEHLFQQYVDDAIKHILAP